ncbi:MAG: GGDEF domain-containing protein [Solirubrobacteraceae bacterium]|nr:GGDEF domain-containing protein [Solirubrobacteraceae bacterium]
MESVRPHLRLLRWLGLVGYRPTEPESVARQISRSGRGKAITVGLLVTMGLGSYGARWLLDLPDLWVAAAACLVSALIITATPIAHMHPRWYHVLPLLTLVPWAVGAIQLAPNGGLIGALLVFLGPTIAFVIEGKPARAIHAGIVVAFVAGVLVFSDQSGASAATFGAALLCAAGLGAFIRLVWVTAEAQGGMLEQLVRRDPLTGVGNRRVLGERLDYEIARHARVGTPLTLLVLDLNGFKHVNDEIGHAAGDQLLREVGAVLAGGLRGHDTVVRPGGDEFCVVAPETSAEDAERLVAGIRGMLATIDAAGAPLTAAIGAATFPADAADAGALLEAADARQREDKVGSVGGPEFAGPPPGFVMPPPIELPASVPLPSAEEDHVPLSRRVSRQPGVRAAVVWVYVIGGLAGAAAGVALDLPTLFFIAPGAVLVGVATRLVPTATMSSRLFHLGPIIASAVISVAVLACEPWTFVPMPLYMFSGAAIGFMMERRRGRIAQTILATGLVALPLVVYPGDDVQTTAVIATLVALYAMVLFIALPWQVVEEQAEELGRLLRRDPLTGVGNRRLLHERLDYELARHQRTGRRLALFVLDLNDFKAINDTLGHAAGDEVLCAAAAALRGAVRRQDTVARQGGDEFCILAPETGPEDAARIVRNVREALGGVDAGERGLAGAIGFAVFPDDGTEQDALVEVADQRQRADKGPSPRRARRSAAVPAIARPGARFPV